MLNTRFDRQSSVIIMSLVLLMMLASSVGCTASDRRRMKFASAEQNYSEALDSKSADVRRDAVVRISKSGYRASDDAFRILDVVARTDPDDQVRCIAIRTLARYPDGRPVSTLMTILTVSSSLNNQSERPESAESSEATEPNNNEAVVANDDVRWEAAEALATMQSKKYIDADQQGAACELFIQMQRADRSRNVRIASTRALGQFKDPRAGCKHCRCAGACSRAHALDIIKADRP